eukprot:scaffold175128_cov33-Tisochrysis_lutea.AAC.1
MRLVIRAAMPAIINKKSGIEPRASRWGGLWVAAGSTRIASIGDGACAAEDALAARADGKPESVAKSLPVA